ncbi:MAG: glycosyltransferase family 4 protein [Pseudomonadota bacterium]
MSAPTATGASATGLPGQSSGSSPGQSPARDLVMAVPGDLNTVTGGYAYDRAVIAHLPAHGWQPSTISLGPGFPAPTSQTLDAAMAGLAQIQGDQPLIIDGLAYGVLPADRLQALANPIIALVHHPLALETGVEAVEAERLRHSEKAALALADAILVTSPHTKRVLIDQFTVPDDKITVATPGVPLAAEVPVEKASPPLILSVGTITRRKGVDLLLRSLAGLQDRAWQAVICGGREHDPVYAAEIDQLMVTLGLEDRVHATGSVSPDVLADWYAKASFFVLASHYEGYGMAFAEALRHGLPVVGFDVGAVPDTVGGGGILLADGDQRGLQAALARLLDDSAYFETMVMKAKDQGRSYPQWSDTAGIVAGCLNRVMEQRDG